MRGSTVSTRDPACGAAPRRVSSAGGSTTTIPVSDQKTEVRFAGTFDGWYWARTSDPQLVEAAGLVLTLRKAWRSPARLQRFSRFQRCRVRARFRAFSDALVSTS